MLRKAGLMFCVKSDVDEARTARHSTRTGLVQAVDRDDRCHRAEDLLLAMRTFGRTPRRSSAGRRSRLAQLAVSRRLAADHQRGLAAADVGIDRGALQPPVR